jgi:hypothetical protein
LKGQQPLDISPDEKRTLEALRANMANRIPIPGREPDSSPGSMTDGPPPDFFTLDSCFDVYNVPLSSERAWSGSVRVICRRILWKLLGGFLQPQIQHNAVVAHAVRALWYRKMPSQEQFWSAADQIDQLRRIVRQGSEELEELRLETLELKREMQALRQALERSANADSSEQG